jgi:hypothetical protein
MATEVALTSFATWTVDLQTNGRRCHQATRQPLYNGHAPPGGQTLPGQGPGEDAAADGRPRSRCLLLATSTPPSVFAMVRADPLSFQLWMRPNAGLILYVASLSLADGEAPQRRPEQTWPRPCLVGPLQQLRQGSPEG